MGNKDSNISEIRKTGRAAPKHTPPFRAGWAARNLIFNAKGLVHHSMENFREAIRLYDKALGARRDKDLAYILANKGNAWYDLEMYDEALESYARALSLNNSNYSAHRGL